MAHGIHYIRLMGALAYFITVLFAPLVVCAIEIAAIGWKRSAIRCAMFDRNNSRTTDLVFFAIQLSGFRELSILLCSFGLVYFSRSIELGITHHAVKLSTGSAPLNALVYVCLFTFFDYWHHRMQHYGPFWNLHRLHHSAVRLSPMVSSRNHPASLVFEPIFRVWPLAFCAVSAPWFVTISLANSFYQFLVHIDTRWAWGWFGRWIVISPVAHRIHHSPMPEHFNKNLAMLPIWDRVFGTWYSGDVINDNVGLGEPLHNKGNFLKEAFTDVVDFVRSIPIPRLAIAARRSAPASPTMKEAAPVRYLQIPWSASLLRYRGRLQIRL
jgi:sterol desaturase/sphingolipid hydroxylase (fatty acid hydroxylase superfamily)